MDFQEWLAQRGIDCNELTPELQASLQAQYESDCQRAAPVAEILVQPEGCQWPAREYRLPANQ